MADVEQTKVCPLCAETIKAAAKVCPHCRHWQKKWALQNPQMVATLMMLVIFGYATGLVIFLDHVFNRKHDFAQYQSQIAVVSSGTSFHISESNLTVSVIGVITNQSDVGWKDVGIEAQFFDGTGQMIDVIQATGEYRELTVLPHSEASFKIQGRANKKEGEYKSTRVFVRTGTDVDAWP